jgi:hypothetical protein
VSLMLGVGNGAFVPHAPVLMPGGVDDVGATDLDDDGDLDLVVGNSGLNGGERIYIDYSRHFNPIHFLICLIKHH